MASVRSLLAVIPCPKSRQKSLSLFLACNTSHKHVACRCHRCRRLCSECNCQVSRAQFGLCTSSVKELVVIKTNQNDTYSMFITYLISNPWPLTCESCCGTLTAGNPLVCLEARFKCRNGRCVDRSFLCNGQDNCQDNSDEEHCLTTAGKELHTT